MNVRNRGGFRGFVAASCVALAAMFQAQASWAQRPDTGGHVAELARYFNGVKIAEPVVYGKLAVYPVLVEDVPTLRGRWLTLDAAISRGVLAVSEKGSGNVPMVWIENRSKDEYVFLMTGELIKGGMQTRTVRHDVIVAPQQRIDLEVYCVEAHRWSGEKNFVPASTMLPQSIQLKVRNGEGQLRVWSEVARNNGSLNTENGTGSLEVAINSTPVRRKLDDARRAVLPEVPRGTMGFIFVSHGRAVGAEFFGSETLARDLLPKLLDSYVVDHVILDASQEDHNDNRAAIAFFERVCRAGSERVSTPGSGSGICTRSGNLLGDGVSLDEALAHYGVQNGEETVKKFTPAVPPRIIYPIR